MTLLVNQKRLTPYILIFGFVHIVGLISFVFLRNFSLQHGLVTLLCYFFMTCIGGTITYHRLLCHRSFKAPKWFYIFGVGCGIYGLYGKPLSWVAIHRKHHQSADQVDDPHSPKHQSWFQVQFLSYIKAAEFKYVKDLINEPILRFAHKNYLFIHLTIITMLLIIDPKSLIYAYIWPILLTWHCSIAVNYYCHKMGYRNFDTAEESKNFFPLALLVFGEGWHNNHHANPRNPNFGKSWWEVDIGYWIIRLIRSTP
jgi:stearoyl-CoA desaturase (delta-9 desaturase)